MGNKYHYQVFYKDKEYKVYINSIVELRDDFEEIIAYNDLTQLEQILSLRGHHLLVESYHHDNYGNYEYILGDLTHKEKYILSQKLILNAQYFIPSVTGERNRKLKKLKDGSI